MPDALLKVTSHVGRDLLQSAQLFKHEHSVVWEYVSNGLQYKDPETKPTAVVNIDAKGKKISVRDNGRGMLIDDLSRYFKMHAENLDRKHGKPGRGFFGTGKSAAFGIANSLTITTVRNGRLSKVKLTRADIESVPDGAEIPIKVLERERRHVGPNGTLIEIEDVFLKHIDIGSVVRYIERQIAHWPGASVIINNHECQFLEPDIHKQIKIEARETEFGLALGDASLVIKIAKAPLEDELRGIAIVSNGVWHETTLAGCERKPFSEYLFGTLEVPALSQDKSAIPAFDMSRSMKLNPRNELVGEIIRFIGVNLETIRRELERQDRERRRTEEQKKLEQQGSKIAELINKHFREWSSKLKHTMAKAGTGSDLLSAPERKMAEEAAAVFGDELPAILVDGTAGPGPGPRPDPTPDPDPGPGPGPLQGHQVKLDDNSSDKIAKPSSIFPKRRPAGGFNVSFDRLGLNEKRAKYDKETRTILINLEHPRIAAEAACATTKSPVEDPSFLRMAYEIAFTEYAIVLGQELSNVQYYYDPQDALVDVRQTLDDLSKAFAAAWNDMRP